jgi:hypothetical protein
MKTVSTPEKNMVEHHLTPWSNIASSQNNPPSLNTTLENHVKHVESPRMFDVTVLR